MYPAELEIKDTTESITSASHLDFLLSIGRDDQLHTSIYDKRDNFNFHITNILFLSSNIPSLPAFCFFISQLIRYAWACPSYACFIPRARRHSSKLLKQGYLVERLKSFRKFHGRYWDLIQQYEVSLSRMLNGILTLDQLHCLPNRSDFPPISWPWYRAWPSELRVVFMEHLKRVWHASGERLPFRTPGSVPLFGTCYAPIVETSFPELAVSFFDFSLWIPSILSRFCFLSERCLIFLAKSWSWCFHLMFRFG